MKILKLALCAAAASFAMAGAASAQDMDVSFNLGATTDYVFRGATQTMEDPAIFGGVDLTAGLFYAGAWASQVDFGDDTVAEFDLYAGVKPVAGPVTFDLAAIYYGYVDAPSGSDYDYWEVKAAASVPAGPVTLGVATYYSPDFFGGEEEAFYYEGNVSFAPADYVTVSAAVGEQTVDLGADYMTWNAGATFTVSDMFSVDFRYHDTDVDGCANVCDDRINATIKAAF
jgi:uncharacterized protein (TIGR02001 family)